MNAIDTAPRRVMVACALCVSVVAGADAQAQDLTAGGLKTGDRAEVTTNAGTVRGRIRDLSASAIALEQTTVPFDQIQKIDRLGDNVWTGFGYGFVGGALLGATIPRGGGCADDKKAKCIAGPAVIFGLLGMWIDYKHVGRTTVFDRSKSGVPPFAPTLQLGRDEWLAGVSIRVGR